MTSRHSLVEDAIQPLNEFMPMFRPPDSGTVELRQQDDARMTNADGHTTPLVSIIIVNYNGMDVLGACLESVRAQRYRPIEVLVVDNASSDGSVQLVRTKYPEVCLIESHANLGFAGASNRGFEAAHGEYIVLLNNDTVVEEAWLELLLAAVHQPDAGIACSKVLTEGVPPEFYELNGTINYLGYNIMRVFRDLSRVFYASGASLIMRRDLVDHLFLDEYFIYHEDVYLSWRVRLLGFSVAMAQNSVVYHRGSMTSKRQSSVALTFYQERNRVLNCFLFYEIRTLILLTPYFLADALAKLLGSVISARKSLRGVVRAYWWLLTHRKWIRDQRSRVQRTRRAPDSSIMLLMSSDVVDSNAWFARLANRISRGYAGLVGLAHHA